MKAIIDNNDMKHFCSNYDLKSLIPISSCFTNIQVILLAAFPRTIQSSYAIETGVFHFRKSTAVSLWRLQLQNDAIILENRI